MEKLMRQINPPTFSYELAFDLFESGNSDALADYFLEFLDFFQANTAYYLDQDLYGLLDQFSRGFVSFFPQDRFQINPRVTDQFVCHSRLISNLLAVTGRNTDDLLSNIDRHPRNYVKILTALSSRNSISFELSAFFEWNGRLASLWYCIYASGYFCGLSEERSASNLLNHFKFTHRSLNILLDADALYFGCTFVDQYTDRHCKKLINDQVKKGYSKILIKNNPERKKIGFFSNCWQPNHSVYRNYFAYIAELSKEFEITCFNLKSSGNDTQYFHEIISVNDFDELLRHPKFIKNNFQAFYMPDVGMNTESIILANLRIAPVQFCSPGHSVSTYGSNMDYFISGLDVESSENAQNNYSEKLVLIPGMGVIHNVPNYQRKFSAKRLDEFIINCSWHAQKITYRSLNVLRQIIDRSSKKNQISFFSWSESV